MARNKKEFKNIVELGVDKVKLIDSHFSRQGTCAQMARIIHQEWGQLQHVKVKTLEVSLSRYRKKVVSTRMAAGELLADPKFHRIKLAEAEQGLNTAQELAELIENVKGDIQTNILLRNQLKDGYDDKDYFMISRMIRSDMDRVAEWLTKLHNIQINLGIYKKATKKVEIGIVDKTATEYEKNRASMQSNKDLRVLTVEAFQALTEEYEVVEHD